MFPLQPQSTTRNCKHRPVTAKLVGWPYTPTPTPKCRVTVNLNYNLPCQISVPSEYSFAPMGKIAKKRDFDEILYLVASLPIPFPNQG